MKIGIPGVEIVCTIDASNWSNAQTTEAPTKINSRVQQKILNNAYGIEKVIFQMTYAQFSFLFVILLFNTLWFFIVAARLSLCPPCRYYEMSLV